MNHIYTEDLTELIHLKLETTRAICHTISHSSLHHLPECAKLEFADIIELIAILMLQEAGEFPEEWTSENLMDVYHFKLPTRLSIAQRQNIKDILLTYLQFVDEALELPNYREIQKNLAS